MAIQNNDIYRLLQESQLESQSQPLYTYLSSSSSPQQIAAAYNQFVAGQGGDTQANQAEAIRYLQSIGVTPEAINQAYDVYKQSYAGPPPPQMPPAPAPPPPVDTQQALLNQIRATQPQSILQAIQSQPTSPETGADAGPIEGYAAYDPSQTAPGQTFQRYDPSGQLIGTQQFKQPGNILQLGQQFAEDVSPLALAALGVNPGLAAGLGSAAGSALGMGALEAGTASALGSGLASTGIGLAAGQNPLDAIKTGLLTGATGMVPELASGLVPPTGNPGLDFALKSAVQSGAKAALTGQNPQQAILGALTAAGVGPQVGIDPKIIGNAVNVILSGGNPQQIFNTVVSAAQGGLIPGAGPAAPETPSLPAYQSPSRQLDTPQQEATYNQLIQAFQQEQGRPPSEGEKVAFLLPAALGVPSALQALTGILPLAGGALWLAAQQKQQQTPPAGMTQQEWLASQQPTRDTTQGSVSPATLAAQGAAALTPSDETARLAARYPAPTTTPLAAPRAPNVDPILQLIQQTQGTPYDVSGDPYAQLPGLTPPETGPQQVPGVTSPPVDTSIAGKPAGVVDTTVPGVAPSGLDLTIPGRATDQAGLPTTTPFAGVPAGAGGGGTAVGGGGETTGEAAPADDAAAEAEVVNLLNRLRGTTTAPAAGAGSPEPGTTGEEIPLAAAAATTDAQRLANLLGIDVNTANALIATSPDLYGQLIGGATTGVTPADPATMPETALRNVNVGGQTAATDFNVIGAQPTTVPATTQVGTAAPVVDPILPALFPDTFTQPTVAPTTTTPAVTTPTPTVAPTLPQVEPVTTPAVTTTTPVVQPVPTLAPTLTEPVVQPTPTATSVGVTTPPPPPVPTTAPPPSLPTTPTTTTGTVTTTPPTVPPVLPPPVVPPPTVTPPPGTLPPTEGPEPPSTPPESPEVPVPELTPPTVEPTITPEPPPPPGTPPSPPPPPAPSPSTAPSPYVFDPKTTVLTQALTAFEPRGTPGRVGLAYSRPAGEIESEVTGKKRRDVWNEASLRLKDALGL